MKNSNKIRNTIKNTALIILGGLIFGGVAVYAETLLSSNQVIYDNSNSGSYSDTVQGALDELYARQGMYDNIRIVDNTIYFNTEYIGAHPVYFNPTTGGKCDDYTETNSQTGKKDGCMKWYAYSQNADGTINMILDHNTTATVAWNKDNDTSSSNSNGPGKQSGQLLDVLKSDTIDWNGTYIPHNYIPSNSEVTDLQYVIYGEEFKARLITAEEVAQITEITEQWKINNSSRVIFDGSKYGWLFDNTRNCKQDGCNVEQSTTYGYWTVSPVVNYLKSAWLVFHDGALSYGNVYDGAYCGVRPVITVSKETIY